MDVFGSFSSKFEIILFSGKYVFIGSRDRTAILWNLSGFLDCDDESEVAPLEILLGHEVCNSTHSCNVSL